MKNLLGIVLDTRSLDELFPDGSHHDQFIEKMMTRVEMERMKLLWNPSVSISLPIPKMIKNTDKNYIGNKILFLLP